VTIEKKYFKLLLSRVEETQKENLLDSVRFVVSQDYAECLRAKFEEKDYDVHFENRKFEETIDDVFFIVIKWKR